MDDQHIIAILDIFDDTVPGVLTKAKEDFLDDSCNTCKCLLELDILACYLVLLPILGLTALAAVELGHTFAALACRWCVAYRTVSATIVRRSACLAVVCGFHPVAFVALGADESVFEKQKDCNLQ